MIYVKMTKREWFANELIWCAIATAAFFGGFMAGSQL